MPIYKVLVTGKMLMKETSMMYRLGFITKTRPCNYEAIFHDCENDNFQLIFFLYFHIFAQNILWVH